MACAHEDGWPDMHPPHLIVADGGERKGEGGGQGELH